MIKMKLTPMWGYEDPPTPKGLNWEDIQVGGWYRYEETPLFTCRKVDATTYEQWSHNSLFCGRRSVTVLMKGYYHPCSGLGRK